MLSAFEYVRYPLYMFMRESRVIVTRLVAESQRLNRIGIERAVCSPIVARLSIDNATLTRAKVYRPAIRETEYVQLCRICSLCEGTRE